MLGFYNRSVILTYIGLIFSFVGMSLAFSGQFGGALACLMLCGVCDMFDGKIARATPRSDDAKLFGIQIDSLCDLVCFGVQPAVICLCMGADSAVCVAVLSLYVLAAVIRLGYFNVREQQRQAETDENRKQYQGLPVTTAAWLVPLFCFVFRFLQEKAFIIALTAWMGVLAALFVTDFRLKKPQNNALLYAAGAVLVLAAVAVLLWL